MITITRRRRSGGHTDHKIYTKEEADDQGIDYVHWKDAEIGDWAITDDDYVMECEQIYETDGKSSQIILTGGRAWDSKHGEILFEPNHEMEIYTMNRPQHWSEAEARRTTTKNAMKVLAASLVTTGKPDYETAAHVYRQDEEIPVATLKRLLKQERIQKVLREELRKIYEEKGMTESSVVDDIMWAVEQAKEKKDLSNLNRVLETKIDLLDMKPGKERTRVDEFEFDVSKSIKGDVEEERARMKGKSTTSEGKLPSKSEDSDSNLEEIEEAEYEEE